MVYLETHSEKFIESVDETLSNFFGAIDDGIRSIATDIIDKNKVALGGVYLHHSDPKKCAKVHLDIEYRFEDETNEITVYCEDDLDGRILWLQCIGTASVDIELVNHIYKLAEIQLNDDELQQLKPEDFWFNPTFNHISLTKMIQNRLDENLETLIKEAE